MKAPQRVRATLGLAIVCLLVVSLAPAGASAAQQQAASLRVSPGIYVGGQKVTFEGNLGRRGVQRVRVQTHMARPGDSWTVPEGGFSTWTNRDGSFRFTYPAPSMFGIKVRVASARAATPARTLNARTQDLVLRATTPGLEPGQVLAGEPFVIDVDTTPTLPGRSDLPGPAFGGRTLTLQQRDPDDEWDKLDETRTDQKGKGSFDVTVGQPGTVVYRVRQEDWKGIGWSASFPTYVHVLAGLSQRGATGAAPASVTSTTMQRGIRTSAATGESMSARLSTKKPTAAAAHSWGRSLWDFAWEFGESLTSRPYRGSDRQGWWLDASDGSGRASKHNGGLMLDSQRELKGQGDHGTTSVTLHDNPRTYGRWETKFRLKSPENNARDYRVRVELVPDRPNDYHCGAQNITVADVAAHAANVTVGAKALQGRRWTYRKHLYSLNGPTAAFAVEVAKAHISWFVNGRAIATVRSKAAVSDVPMTLRLSLVGDDQAEMNRTQAIFDWQRGYSLTSGRSVTSGHGLRRSTYAGGC